MTNKEKLKKVIENDFNKEKNYENIINKSIKINKLPTYTLTTLCIIFIIGILIKFNYQTFINSKNTNITTDIININYTNILESTSDTDGNAEDININEIYKIEPKLKNIFIPNDLKNERNIKMYSRNDIKSSYNILDGYNIMYVDSNQNLKNIEIFISKTLKEKRRCISISNTKNKISTINNTNVTIICNGNTYIANLKYNNIYYDIETKNITQNELIQIIKSIVQ